MSDQVQESLTAAADRMSSFGLNKNSTALLPDDQVFGDSIEIGLTQQESEMDLPMGFEDDRDSQSPTLPSPIITLSPDLKRPEISAGLPLVDKASAHDHNLELEDAAGKSNINSQFDKEQ